MLASGPWVGCPEHRVPSHCTGFLKRLFDKGIPISVGPRFWGNLGVPGRCLSDSMITTRRVGNWHVLGQSGDRLRIRGPSILSVPYKNRAIGPQFGTDNEYAGRWWCLRIANILGSHAQLPLRKLCHQFWAKSPACAHTPPVDCYAMVGVWVPNLFARWIPFIPLGDGP